LKLNRRGLGVKLWLYFVLLAAVVLGLIWLLQIVFLSYFYEGMKVHKIEKAAGIISQAVDTEALESTIDYLAYKNSILVYVTDLDGELIYSSDEHGSGLAKAGDKSSPSRSSQRELPDEYDKFLELLAKSDEGEVSYTINQSNFTGRTLIYGRQLPEAVIYISTPLEPLDSTTNILATQLIIVTAIALVLCFGIAFFLARKFSRPITQITKSAGALAEGNYSVQFEADNYTEIEELAATLNHTARELSKVENLRRELIANVSHDLRTPLTMIKGYTEMIREFSGDDPVKRERHLEVIQEETERLEKLVNDMLTLSVLQSGNVMLDRTTLNLSECLTAILKRFEVLSEHEAFQIRAEIQPELMVSADRMRMEQVFYNLLGNAVNYAGEEKQIDVRLTDTGEGVLFEVQDYGDGIEEEELAHIWDRYYKANNQTRTKVGTGIGLSIVKNILQMHEAGYGVDSKPGEGCRFWFMMRREV